jgi:hypothetical protein
MTTHSDEINLRALAAAMKDVRAPTVAAWARVRAALALPMPIRRLSLRPMMASLTVVVAFVIFSQVGLINALAHPTVTAGIVPGPHAHIASGTPAAGIAAPVATTTPQPASDAVPIPLPPGRS